MVSVKRYIIDTSSMLSQKLDEQYRRNVFRTLWERIDAMVQAGDIVTCSETASEVQDDEIKQWLRSNKMQILTIDDEIQANVTEIVNVTNTDLVDLRSNKSSADAFLIATAKKYGLTVITEEAANSPKKIPFTCQKMHIPCVNLLGFMEENSMSL